MNCIMLRERVAVESEACQNRLRIEKQVTHKILVPSIEMSRSPVLVYRPLTKDP